MEGIFFCQINVSDGILLEDIPGGPAILGGQCILLEKWPPSEHTIVDFQDRLEESPEEPVPTEADPDQPELQADVG